jgi:FkbM family methyltransferase
LINGSEYLLGIVPTTRLTAVVDVGANPIDGETPYHEMLSHGLCTLTGFEPQAAALAILDAKKGPRETYLPYAVGDGKTHTLRVAAASGMTSLLEPDITQLNLFNGFPEWGTVSERVQLVTRRLDDIEAVDQIDMLKIDVQGSELMVFRGGQRKLGRAVAIHTEVSFVALYEHQPPFGEVDLELRALGFIPHAVVSVKRWPIAPVVFDGDFRTPMHQVLEADVVYVRDFAKPEAMSDEQLAHLALIAHCVYGSSDLTYRCIMTLRDRGVVPADAPDAYLAVAYGDGSRR